MSFIVYDYLNMKKEKKLYSYNFFPSMSFIFCGISKENFLFLQITFLSVDSLPQKVSNIGHAHKRHYKKQSRYQDDPP